MRSPAEHLLIVEDDQEMRDLLRKVLEKEGYRVSVAGDGAEALSLLDGETFDLVVTDMLMPVKNGLDLLHDVHRSRPSLPVIMVTAFGDWASYARAVEEGAAAFIKKPLRMAELVAAVQSTLSRPGGPRPEACHVPVPCLLRRAVARCQQRYGTLTPCLEKLPVC